MSSCEGFSFGGLSFSVSCSVEPVAISFGSEEIIQVRIRMFNKQMKSDLVLVYKMKQKEGKNFYIYNI